MSSREQKLPLFTDSSDLPAGDIGRNLGGEIGFNPEASSPSAAEDLLKRLIEKGYEIPGLTCPLDRDGLCLD